ncbi:MAG: hypothetical protein JSR69_24070 [Proteobacteria bacterium]|nr:hypothetical protein [Pseudomonadota bacterium]
MSGDLNLFADLSFYEGADAEYKGAKGGLPRELLLPPVGSITPHVGTTADPVAPAYRTMASENGECGA